MTLSLACIINMESPSARLGRIIFPCNLKLHFLSRKNVFLPERKCNTHIHDNACEIIVASAAPRTPIPNTNINIGSRIILDIAPITTESILVLAKP